MKYTKDFIFLIFILLLVYLASGWAATNIEKERFEGLYWTCENKLDWCESGDELKACLELNSDIVETWERNTLINMQ
jgi:hypothetical protein